VFVVRFTLPTAQDLYVKGVGWFVAGVLDVDATDLDAVSRARYLVTSYGAIEIGEVPSWTPPPDLPGAPAGPAPDPYPQYLTLEDIGDAIEAGAIPELRAAFGRGVSVTAYGAVGNGTTDDSSAFRTALATGQPVYVPAGTYRVSRDGVNAWALTLPTGTRLHGPGRILLAPGSAVSVRVLHIAAADVHVDGLTIDGNRATQSVEANAQRHGIIVTGGATGISLANLDLRANSGDGILVAPSADVRIANNRITNCERNGITLYAFGGDVLDVTILGNHIEADVQPIDSEPDGGYVNDIRIHGNYLRALGDGYALTVAGATATPARGWSVIGNTMVGALYVINQQAAKIIGNTIDARNSPTHNGVHALFSSTDILLANNEILTANNQFGVNMQLSSGTRPVGWKVLGNIIKTLGTSARGINMTGIGQALVADNTIRGVNGEIGVHVQATADLDSLDIVNNSVEGFGFAGIYAAPFSTFQIKSLRIVGNRVINEEAVPVANTGVWLAGTAAQFLSTVVRENTVSSVYGTAINLGSVTVGPELSYSRTGETTQVAAIRAAMVALGLVKDSTTA
jgi:hypothetical protein